MTLSIRLRKDGEEDRRGKGCTKPDKGYLALIPRASAFMGNQCGGGKRVIRTNIEVNNKDGGEDWE